MFLVIVQKQRDGSRKFLGSEFQNIGPATEKARRPYVVSRWDGITSWWPAAGRRCCLEVVVETGTKHAARYRGAEPYRHRRVITPSLYLTRSGTSSQWSSVCIAVELPCTTDYTSCRVQHSLQLVGDDISSPSEDNVTVVDAGRHEGVHERRGRLRSQWAPDVP